MLLLFTAMTGCGLFHMHNADASDNLPVLINPFVLKQPPIIPHDINDFHCAAAPPVIRDLEYSSVYTDRSEGVSKVDEKAQKRYRKEMKPISKYEEYIVRLANRHAATGLNKTPYGDCALQWMADWAQQDGFLGRSNELGQAVRKWTLGSIAAAYLQIQEKPQINLDTSASDPENQNLPLNQTANHHFVQKWIHDLAYQVKKDYSTHADAKSRNNNHLYWAAWSVMASSIALNDHDLYDWALKKAHQGINAITPEGTLPLEMAREYRAYHYHTFAMLPLVMMAEASTVNGAHLYTEKGSRLSLLADRILSSVDNIDYFEQATGKDQDLKSCMTPAQFAWLPVYAARHPEMDLSRFQNRFSPPYLRRIGGDMSLFFGQ